MSLRLSWFELEAPIFIQSNKKRLDIGDWILTRQGTKSEDVFVFKLYLISSPTL